jgi:hypothetical protein
VFAQPQHARELTDCSILGLEPAVNSEVFRQQWYMAMFRAAGVELVNTLEAACDGVLPDWFVPPSPYLLVIEG